MTCRLTLFVALATAAPCFAAEWNLRTGDVPLTPAEVRSMTAGTILTFYDDGQSRYFPDGRYSYTYSQKNGGGTARGTYVVRDDGSVCVTYPNGFDRCDLYVRHGERLVLITEKGDRFPVRH